MDVVAWTYHPAPARATALGLRYAPLDEVLGTADVVSIHVRLTPESRGLLGPREIGLMRPGAILVNTARAPVVDTEALVAALQAGRLGGAALDVFDAEPLPPGHPLLACDQVILTPHNADQTPEGMDVLNAGVVDNVIAFLEGRPQNVVA
jgi:D-3-phosphoglycerate dehydrogenase